MSVAEKMCELLNNLGYIISYEELKKDDIDLRDFIVDSVEFVSLIVEIEHEFVINLPDEFIEFDVLASLNGIISTIEALLCDKRQD